MTGSHAATPNLGGIWQGTLDGTNWGRALLKVEHDGRRINGDVEISEVRGRTYSLDMKGVFDGGRIEMHLTPSRFGIARYLGEIDIEGQLVEPNAVEGEWASTIDTHGRFCVRRQVDHSDEPLRAQDNAVFIMMAFGRRTEAHLPEEDVLGAIGRASSECGMESRRADDIEHDGRITDAVATEIQNCRFLMGDITHERPNVYYEVGYAHGLGKSVILAAQEGTEPHFDIAGYNIIFYSSATDLESQLVERLNSGLTSHDADT